MNSKPGTDTELLESGVSIVKAMALAARAARSNRSLSKYNRQFYARQEAALQELVAFVLFHRYDRGVGC